MKTRISIKDIRALNPCYDPAKFLKEAWTGTVTDILKMKDVTAEDKLWVVLHKEFLNDTVLKRFALACARQCEKYADDSDVKYCNDIVEAFLDGYATQEELTIAQAVARYATNIAFSAYTYSANVDAQEEQCEILIDIIKRYSK